MALCSLFLIFMSQYLTANEWGFSMTKDNPFAIFGFLQEVAKKSVGEMDVIDLSRGDPGYGFTPSERGRRFYSYLLQLDTFLNNETDRFVNVKREHLDDALKRITDFTHTTYSKKVAEDLLKDMDEFGIKIEEMARESGLEWDRFDVLNRIFRHSTVSGGNYLDPQGEEIVRVVLAHWYRQFIEVPLDHEDIILTYGASHAIGTLFKGLGTGGLGYLKEGSMVLVSSPVYAPYNFTLNHRDIDSFVLSVDPFTGDLLEESLQHLEQFDGELKAVILIDPNNPTGFSLTEESLRRIAGVARKHNALIITDEVYTSFFPRKKTMVDFAPERTVRIDARSKIERSTGLRFGDMFISKEANEYITKQILQEYLSSGQDVKEFLIQAKGPGGSDGELQHTTFVPGPSQFLGISHMVLAQEERQRYFEGVRHNVDVFVKELGLPHEGNLYYAIFDMNSIERCTKKSTPPEEKLLALAKSGVVYLPANLFFSEHEREKQDMTNMVRASVVNTSIENVERAALITKKYLTS